LGKKYPKENQFSLVKDVVSACCEVRGRNLTPIEIRERLRKDLHKMSDAEFDDL